MHSFGNCREMHNSIFTNQVQFTRHKSFVITAGSKASAHTGHALSAITDPLAQTKAAISFTKS